MVSGNSTEMDGIPALKTPYRKKLARAAMQRDTTYERDREKVVILASSHTLNAQADKLEQDTGTNIPEE